MTSNELFEHKAYSEGLSRRGFLGAAGKTSALATMALYSASGMAVLTNARSVLAADAPYKALREADIKYFKAILPVVIQQANPDEDNQDFLKSIDLILAHADVETIELIRQLVDLATGTISRVVMTGTLWDWPDLAPQNVENILESWRDSYFELPKVLYGVSTRLTATAWYMIPSNQRITGYEGPPKKIVD